jgi:TIR domain/Tetratricopeptide repeat
MEPPLTPSDPPSERERGAFVFFSYAHRDKGFRDRLEEHLSNLKYRGLITTWYDREISAGEEWAQQIDIHLNKAQVILLLISASFMASEYCYSIEMRRALERHEHHEADVIPILLRPVLYTDAPFAKLQMLPTNGKPIVLWHDRDSAFVDIAYAIERVAQKYLTPAQTTPGPPVEQMPYVGEQAVPPESPPLSPPMWGAVPSGSSATPQPPPPPSTAVQADPQAPPARRRRLSFLILGVVGLVICVIASSSLFLLNLGNSNVTPTPTPTPTSTSIPAPTPTPTPTPPTPIPISIIILGILLLVGVIAALIVIGAIRARIGQRRAQGASEEARKRGYYEQAIEAYRHALARNPLDEDALRGMGNALCALGLYDQALDAFTQAIDCDPTPATYAGLGDVFAKLKRYTEAVEVYEKAMELDPTVTLNYDDFMQALRVLGRKEEAERVYAWARQLGYEDQE